MRWVEKACKVDHWTLYQTMNGVKWPATHMIERYAKGLGTSANRVRDALEGTFDKQWTSGGAVAGAGK